MKVFILVGVMIFMLGFGAAEFGYNNPSGPLLSPDPTTFNNNTASVNSSKFWDTISLGPLDDANITQFENNGGTLTISTTWFSSFFDFLFGNKDTDDLAEGSINLYDNRSWNESLGNDLYVNKIGDTFTQKIYQWNFTFSNTSLPLLDNFNSFLVKNLNSTSSGSLSLENNLNKSVGFFASGSEFGTAFNLNNSVGVFANNSDLLLTTTTPGKNILFRTINSTGDTLTTLIIESDGNVLFQNDIILNLSSIFLDDVGDRFIKINSEGFPFNGLSVNATWMAHNNPKSGGEITFLNTVENDTVSWTTSLKNFSYSLLSGNSGGLVPGYMAEDNFTENGIINMTKASDYILLCSTFGVDCNFNADTRGNTIDLIPGGPLLWTMGDLEIWQSAKIHKGISVEGDADFDLQGNDFNIDNGTLHIATPVTFERGFTEGDEVIKFTERFDSGIGIFTNLQSDLGNWINVLNPVFCDEGDCARGTGAGVGVVSMQTNISTVDVNETAVQFVYSLVDLVGVGDFEVIVNNNVGSGDVSIFSDSTNNVLLSSQDISLPSSMDDEPIVSLTFICTNAAGKPNRECFVDTVRLNGTAKSTTLINVSDFNGVIAFSTGDLAPDGFPEIGIFYDAPNQTIVIRGNATFENIVEQTLNITDSLFLSSFTEGSVPFIGANGLVSEDIGNFTYDSSTHSQILGGGLTVNNNQRNDIAGRFTWTSKTGKKIVFDPDTQMADYFVDINMMGTLPVTFRNDNTKINSRVLSELTLQAPSEIVSRINGVDEVIVAPNLLTLDSGANAPFFNFVIDGLLLTGIGSTFVTSTFSTGFVPTGDNLIMNGNGLNRWSEVWGVDGFFENMNITGLSGSYTGGSAHVCVFNNGSLFSSEGACP